MSAAPVFRSRPGRQLLWAVGLLAMLWLATIAWQTSRIESPSSNPAVYAASPAEVPARPAFEEMLAAIADNRTVSPAQWQAWQELNAKALAAAQSTGNPSNALQDTQANLQLLAKELATQLEAARNTPQLIWLQLRLSRANPQLRLYEQERVEVERTPADLSRLLLRLFAASLPADSLEPNWLAYEASCPVWGEISQAIGQLQKDVEAQKGRRSDLARRSLSTLEQPSLIAPIHAQAAQCSSVIESRKAVATLAKVLAQVPWAEVFAVMGSAPSASEARTKTDASPKADRAGSGLLSARWVPLALGLGLISLLVLALTSRARSRDLRKAYEDLEEESQRSQRQIEQLRARLMTQEPSLQIEDRSSAPVDPARDLPAQGQEPDDGSSPQGPFSTGEPAPLTAQRPVPSPSPDQEQPPHPARIGQARERLRSAQLGLIQGLNAEDVLRELDQAQALLAADLAAEGDKGQA